MPAAFFVLVEVSEGGEEAFAGGREIGGGAGFPKKSTTLWRKRARSWSRQDLRKLRRPGIQPG